MQCIAFITLIFNDAVERCWIAINQIETLIQLNRTCGQKVIGSKSGFWKILSNFIMKSSSLLQLLESS